MNSTDKREGWQRGWHGYDNELMDMRGIFLAFGPGRWGNDPVVLSSIPRDVSPGAGGASKGWHGFLCTPFMRKAEQTQPVSMKHLWLACFQMLLGFGKCGQIVFLINFKP